MVEELKRAESMVKSKHDEDLSNPTGNNYHDP